MRQQRIEALVVEGLSLVDKIAERVHRRLCAARWSRRVDLDDLKSAGRIGLLQAADRFEAGRVPFAAFASRRIYGAIVDDFREHCAPLSRAQWRDVKDGAETFFEEPLSDTVTANAADPAPTPERLAIVADNRRRLLAAIAALPSWRDRRVLARFEREETQADIAAALGINESRVSQIERRAVRQVRDALTTPRSTPIDRSARGPVQVAATATVAARRARTWATDPRRRAKAVENGKRGAAVANAMRRPPGGFGARHRVA